MIARLTVQSELHRMRLCNGKAERLHEVAGTPHHLQTRADFMYMQPGGLAMRQPPGAGQRARAGRALADWTSSSARWRWTAARPPAAPRAGPMRARGRPWPPRRPSRRRCWGPRCSRRRCMTATRPPAAPVWVASTSALCASTCELAFLSQAVNFI